NSAIGAGTISYSRMSVTNAGGSISAVVTYDSNVSDQFLIRTGTSNIFGTGRMQLYKITGSSASPTFSMLPFAAIGTPWSISIPDAPQLGTSSTIQTNDDRVGNGVYRNASVWAANTV